ncbi:kinase domain-containing protein [Amylocarpus encephaloides]|uniref:Kinase domain-containing protein n=1 Tax=Amylocarpus encephaloides TaxID=45428 RepID=A0A9P7YPL6_9HELO|nr:kinase domain-containing protein [Amylocarpus encephaloides]
MAQIPGLYGKLRVACRNDKLNSDRQYIPVDVVDEKITKDSIKAELGRKSKIPNWWWSCLAARVEKNNVKRVFSVLVYVQKPSFVEKLLESGFTDEDLPLVKHREEMRSVHDPTRTFSIPKEWEDQTVDDFIKKQWMVLAPIFDTSGKHMVLDPLCPLPFSTMEEVVCSPRNLVYKAKVYPSHQEGFEVEAPSLQVALKEFKYKVDFEHERENLNKIRGLKNNKHITQNFATFSQGNKHYIIFPWAVGGDLDNFWKNGKSKSRTPRLALWCLRQMLGLTEALLALHREIGGEDNCRHGDLKPGNILHFLTGEEGILKITDFGISRIHNNATFQRMENPTTTRATTPSYEAPEAAPALSRKQARSRKYDIWSLGCIFLEFTIWHVCGWEVVQSFNAARKSGSPGGENWAHFYQITNDTARVHPEVTRIIADLKGSTEIKATALGEFVDLIEKSLLEVKVEDRIDSAQLSSRVRGIVEKAESDPVYLEANLEAPTS